MSHSVFDNNVVTSFPHTNQLYNDHDALHIDFDESFNMYTSTALQHLVPPALKTHAKNYLSPFLPK